MTSRDEESALLERCTAAARGRLAEAGNQREANVFRLAAMVLSPNLPVESRRLMAASERAEAEAALARQLLAELRVAPREREGGGGRRRKAGGPAPTEKQAQSEEEGKEQGKEQGAPAASLNPDNGNDGNEGK
ncbi:hypothetical protein [Cupriavidus necator]